MGARICVLLVGMVSIARADSPPIDAAIKRAAAAHKALVLEFHAQWCGPCREFEAKVLPDPRVQESLKTVVYVRYDVDETAGEQAAARYSVNSFPTFLVVDGRGVEVLRERGAPLGEYGVEVFIELIQKARNAITDEATLRASLKMNRDNPTVLLSAANWFADRNLLADALPLYEAISTHKEATTAQRFEATSALVTHRRKQQWARQLLGEKLALIRADPAHARDEDLVLATVRSNLPLADVRAVWKKVFDATPGSDRLYRLIYIALAADASQEALAAAKRLVELRRDPQYLDALAECYHVRGDRKQALAISDQALIGSDAPSRDRDVEAKLRENRKRFDRAGDDATTVRDWRVRAASLWKRVETIDQLDTKVSNPDVAPRAERERDAMIKKFTAERTLAAKIADACVAHAAGSEEAVARVELDFEGKIKSSVLLLEPTATKALRDCLTKQLTGAALVPGTSRLPSRLYIHFKH